MRFSHTLIAGAVAAALAGIASAQTERGTADALPESGSGPIYFGGGATLPAIGYVGSQAATNLLVTNPAYNLNTGGEVSAFGYFDKVVAANPSTTKVSYCQTGSGAGKRVFYGATSSQPATGSLPASASSPCGTTTTTVGFGATNGQKFADFAASDSPQSSAEYNFYKTNSAATGTNISGRGEPVQLPAVVGSVALLYNNADVGTAKINLTTAQVCGIFAGQITDWKTLKSTLPSKKITVIYRSDGSGTTFSFSNFLSSRNANNVRNVCTGSGQTFALDSAFTKVFPGGSIPASVTNFVGASGNPGVVAKIAGDPMTTAIDGSIGYVEAANAIAAAKQSSSDGINFATLNGKDPVANLPESAASIPATAIVKDKAIGAYVVNGRPALEAVIPSAAANCTLLVDPSKYSLPSSGYPIVAVSYLLFASKGNTTANVANLRNLGQFLTKTATYSGSGPVNTINKASTATGTGTKGYASLPLATGSGSIATTVQSTATSCIGS